MALQDLLSLSSQTKKIGISEERFEAVKPIMRQYIAYWREYPDMFIDFLQTGYDGKMPESGLHFYFYQRVFLRVCMRYKYVYMVFPRAYSKSFLAVLVLMIRCILYPRAKLFVTSGGYLFYYIFILKEVPRMGNNKRPFANQNIIKD